MNQKNIGIALIILGISILLFSYNMDVSIVGSEVVNIHMLLNRQNNLILGCIIFLSGIILFSLAKQNKNESSSIKKYNFDKTYINNILNKSIKNINDIIINYFNIAKKLLVKKEEGLLLIFIRLAVGILIIIVTLPSVKLLSTILLLRVLDINIFMVLTTINIITVLTTCFILFYSFLDKNILDVFSRLFLVSLILIAFGLLDIVTDSEEQLIYSMLDIFYIILPIIGFVSVYIIKKKQIN